MEIDPDDVVANRLEVFAGDVRSALVARWAVRADWSFAGSERAHARNQADPSRTRDGNFPTDEAIRRIERSNDSLPGAIGGAKTYRIEAIAPDMIHITVPQASEDALMKDALGKDDDDCAPPG